jgi:uncharacterized protein (UPF0261 family)
VTNPAVALVGTLDTKGAEYQWVAERLHEHGVEVVVVDAGVGTGGLFTLPVTVTAADVAAAAGASIDRLRASNDRGAAVSAMGEGAAAVLGRLSAAGRLDGVLALGGSGGSSIAARAVRDLPARPHAARRDADAQRPQRPLLAASMFGVTTPAVDAARARLTELGYEVLVFHATGAGGRALEALARSGMLVGVLDLTTTELADDLVGSVLTAGPDRLTAAGAAGIPQVVSLAGAPSNGWSARIWTPAPASPPARSSCIPARATPRTCIRTTRRSST